MLSTLVAANISHEGRYGMALDRTGTTPKLWTPFQGSGTAGLAELGSISLPDGVSLPVTYDLRPYFNGLGIAGGAFIIDRLPGGAPPC